MLFCNKGKLTILFCFLFLASCSNQPQPSTKSVQPSAILQQLDEGFALTETYLADKNTHKELRSDIHTSIKAKVEEIIKKGGFPEINPKSQTFSKISKLYADILRTTIFTIDGDINPKTLPLYNSTQKETISNYMAERLNYDLQKAKAIEPILPNKEQKKKILSQVNQIKDEVVLHIHKQFPKLPLTLLDDAVKSSLTVFYLAPESILHISGKRPLTKRQIQTILDSWKKQFKTIPYCTSDFVLRNLLEDNTEMSEKLAFIRTEAFLDPFTGPLFSIIKKEIQENAPPVSIPAPSSNYKKFINEIEPYL